MSSKQYYTSGEQTRISRQRNYFLSHSQEESNVDSDQDNVQSRSLALLDDLAKRRKGEGQDRKRQETITVLETKCEQLQEELANLR